MVDIIRYLNNNLTMVLPFKKSKRGITLKIRVDPRSSERGIRGLIGDAVKVKVNAPPVGGVANEELMEILSEELGIKKSAIRIVRGHSSRDKVIEISGIDALP